MRKFVVALMIFVLMCSTVYADEPSSWAEDSIKSLIQTSEFEISFFDRYKENITREEFAYFAVRLFELLQGGEIVVDDTIYFNDTNDIYALKAATVGISAGTGNNKFDPSAFLTREQLVVMIIRTLNLGKLELSLQLKEAFNDKSFFSEWAKDAIDVAYANGIINGTGEGNFSPSIYATKEQALVIISNILTQYEDKTFDYLKSVGPVLTMSIEDRNDSNNKGAFVKVFENNKYLGYTNGNGKLKIFNLTPDFHTFSMIFRDGTVVSSGAHLKSSDSNALMWINSNIIEVNKRVDGVVENCKDASNNIILEENQDDSAERVTLLYDDSISQEIRDYIDKLLEDAIPVINNILGPPNQNHSYTLVYNPTKHLGYNNDKTVSTMSSLPRLYGKNDPDFDKWLINEYIHQYLKDYAIPIKGSRSNESRAQALSDLVMNQMSAKGLRNSNQNSLEYYVNLYDVLLPLGPEFILNNGSTTLDASFNATNFNWEPISYNKVNALGLEHHKALWHKLFKQRYMEKGKYDFFVVFMKEMNSGNIDTPSKYYEMMDTLVKQVDGIKTSEWLKQAPQNAGKLENEYSARILPLKGGILSIEGVDNPDMIYPILIKRSPGKLMEDICHITISKDNKIFYDADFKTKLSYGNLSGALNMNAIDLEDGLYEVKVSWDVNGNTLTDSREFHVGNISIPTNKLNEINKKNPITVKYDDSIPNNVRTYIDKLVEIIDPIYRLYVGEPNEIGTFTIKYDPNGYNTMSNHYEILNIKKLPNTIGVDSNFDSFFFIEYFHMFHKGEGMPFEEGRYSENISQLMKILISDYLNSNNIRKVSSKSLTYFVKYFDYINNLGPNILINMGINVNGKQSTRANWEKNSKYGQFMNMFTLDYGLSVWAKLEDARYQKSGKHDFVKEVMLALRTDKIKSKTDFYNFIDEIIDVRIDNKKVVTWLKETSLFAPLSANIYTLALLPVNGNIMNINGNNNPDYIYPFLVERDGAASVKEAEVTIIIKDSSGNQVYKDTILIDIESNYSSYNGFNITELNLSSGRYTIDGEVTVGENLITAESDFIVD